MNQYREGKVKSTPMRGVKETLKPDAYKQWERAHLSDDRFQMTDDRIKLRRVAPQLSDI